MNQMNRANCKCDWSNIVPCNYQKLKPLKCTVNSCNKLVHHLCQIAFEQREGCDEFMALKCCLHHPQSPLRASKPPPVNDPEENLHSSTASNSKTSINDAGKNAAGTDASSSSDESSSSDDSEDGAGSAPTLSRGKNLSIQSRLGQGKQLLSVVPTADDSSEESSNDHKDHARSATTSARGKDLAFQTRLMKAKQLRPELPTAKNRSTSKSRDFSQCVYFDVFTSYARHLLPEDIDEILPIVESVTTNATSQRSGSTNRMSQLNCEVSSWNNKRQIFPSSSSIFNESIGEDGLSSQSTYDVTIDNPHHIEVIRPNPNLLQQPLPSNEEMKTSYQFLVKAVNEMRIQYLQEILSPLLIEKVAPLILILRRYMRHQFV